MTTFVTSDLHLRHRLPAFLRGFDSIEEHDDALESAWRQTVSADDVVWILGDVTMGQLSESLDRVASWPGRKRLVMGNHDQCHPMHAKPSMMRRYARAFDEIHLHAAMRYEGSKVLLSHMPYEGDRGEDRFTQWRLPDHGRTILHGHTHLPERVSRTAAGTPQLHVGIDAWGMAPTPIDDVLALV